MSEAMVRALVVVVLGAIVGCSDERRCGEGTRAEGELCVPLCEPGEHWDSEAEACSPVCSEGTIYNESAGRCEPEVVCGPGTRRVDNVCVPESSVECGAGTSYDTDSGICVPDCLAGTHRDGATGACVPDSAVCITGQVWDSASGECVDVAGFCGAGTTWVASEQACVPDDDLLDADLRESDGENDPRYGGPDAVERLELPEIGTTTVVGGSIDAAVDKDGDGDLEGDYDYFVFTVTTPTLLRITADGVGGASSGFLVRGEVNGDDYLRYGIGTTSDGAVRDVFLPAPGDYALVASDAMNFVTAGSGPFFGGEGLGYFITVERLPVPAAEALPTGELSEGLVTEGVWPVAPPATGSTLGFFSFDVIVDADSVGTLLDLDLSTDAGAVGPVLLLVDESGAVLSGADEPADTRAFDQSTTLTLVTDYVYWFGVFDTPYALTVTDLGLRPLPDGSSAIRISQPSWSAGGGRLPRTYFGFRAEAGTVVTVRATTTTGETSFEVLDARLETSYGWFRGMATSPLYDGSIRFYCHDEGLYLLTALDLAGAWVGASGSPEYLPPHRFDVTAAAVGQVPLAVGALTEPWATPGPETVTAESWERFVVIEPAAGQALEFRVAPEGELEPAVSFYDLSVEGPLTSVAHLSGGFPRRFPEGAPVLFGVSDAAVAAGAFRLAIAPLEVTDLGALSSAAPLDVSWARPSTGERFEIYQALPEEPGLVSLAVTPQVDLDAAVIVRGPHLEELDLADAGLAGEAETVAFVVGGAEPVFFEVASIGGAAEASVELSLALDAYVREVEPNDDARSALPVTLPADVAGTLASAGDRDWYALEAVGAGTLVAETSGALAATTPDTTLVLYGGDGVNQLARDEDGGEGRASRLTFGLPRAGTYYLVVEAGGGGDATGAYFLAVDATLL